MFQKGLFGVLQAPNGQIRFGRGAPEQIFVYNGPLWNVDRPAMFGPSPVMNGGPQSKKRLMTRSPM